MRAESLEKASENCLERLRVAAASGNGEATKKMIEFIQDNLTELDNYPQEFEPSRQRVRAILQEAREVWPDPELQLVVHADARGQVAASAPIRWCLNRSATLELAATMKLKAASEAWILISVVHETAGEVERRLVRIDSMMEYLSFHRAGRHTIYATVIIPPHTRNSEGERAVRRAALMRRKTTTYENKLFDKVDGELIYKPEWIEEFHYFYKPSIMVSGHIDVMVPPEFFSTPPSPRLQSWLMWWRKEPLLDDCDVRKRKIFAFTIQPFIFAFVMLLRYAVVAPLAVLLKFALAVGGTLCSIRPFPNPAHGVNWRGIWGRTFSFEDVWTGSFSPATYEHRSSRGGSYILYDRHGQDRTRDFLYIPLTPMIWVIAFMIGTGHAKLEGRRAILANGIVSAVVMVLLFYAMIGIIAIGVVLANWFQRRRSAKAAASPPPVETPVKVIPRPEPKPVPQLVVPKRIQQLNCQIMPLEVSVDALPKKKQTVRLRFLRLKAKICRPLPVS